MGLLDFAGQIASAASAAYQANLNAKSAARNTDATNAANQKLAEYQYSKDVEMWNKANQYNSPSAQMDRFKAAGLNPNLIYGQGNSGNTATSLPKYQAPTMRYNYQPALDLPSMISAYQDFRIKQNQINILEENRKVAAANAVMKGIDATYYDDQVVNGNLIKGKYWLDWNKRYHGARLAENQASFADQTLAARVRNENLAPGQTLAKTRDLQASARQRQAATYLNGVNAAYRAQQVDWYVANTIANMVTKAIGSLGVGGFVKNLGLPKRVVNQTFNKNVGIYNK